MPRRRRRSSRAYDRDQDDCRLADMIRAGRSAAPRARWWVISRHRSVSTRCPLYPRKRTSLSMTGMSALCHKRTHAVQQKRGLFGLKSFRRS
jgi:hypothetical protein